jgi:hypothetical protein
MKSGLANFVVITSSCFIGWNGILSGKGDVWGNQTTGEVKRRVVKPGKECLLFFPG